MMRRLSQRIYAPSCEGTAISFEERGPSAGEMAKRIGAIGAERPWIVFDDGGVAGYAYASAHHERAAYRWSVSTSVYVSANHQRRGIGHALYTTLFDLLRLLGYFKATAGITLPNPASVRLHEQFGFKQVGIYRGIGFKLGAWHDVAWYKAEIQPPVPNPALPRSIASVHDSPEWRQAVAAGLAKVESRK